MQTKDGFPITQAGSAQEWRQWLQENHTREQAVWLVIYRKESGVPSVYYPEAVDEALCFGWIDSKPNKRDEQSYFQFFSRRNPKSNWSRINKEKVARLTAEGKMAPAGLKMVELAKKTGPGRPWKTWTIWWYRQTCNRLLTRTPRPLRIGVPFLPRPDGASWSGY